MARTEKAQYRPAFLLWSYDSLRQDQSPPPLSPSARFENSWFYHGHRAICGKK